MSRASLWASGRASSLARQKFKVSELALARSPKNWGRPARARSLAEIFANILHSGFGWLTALPPETSPPQPKTSPLKSPNQNPYPDPIRVKPLPQVFGHPSCRCKANQLHQLRAKFRRPACDLGPIFRLFLDRFRPRICDTVREKCPCQNHNWRRFQCRSVFPTASCAAARLAGR